MLFAPGLFSGTRVEHEAAIACKQIENERLLLPAILLLTLGSAVPLRLRFIAGAPLNYSLLFL